MINLLDYLYYLLAIKRKPQGIVFSALRQLIRITANALIPTWYKLTRNCKKYRIEPSQKTSEKIIVSFTSFPARINHVWKVVESILRQTVKPDRIILWLSREQFPSMVAVPRSLTTLQTRGLEIRLVDDDLRSHKKYYYTMKEFPNDVCLTIDDDIFYSSYFIETLLLLHKQFPQAVCCNLPDKILNNKNEILPYAQWVKGEVAMNSLQKYILPIGAGGILYPPSVLHKMVLEESLFMNLCPKADDLWLWAMGQINNALYVASKNKFGYLPVIIKNNVTLATSNTDTDSVPENEIQIRQIVKHLQSIGINKFNFTHEKYEIISSNSRLLQ